MCAAAPKVSESCTRAAVSTLPLAPQVLIAAADERVRAARERQLTARGLCVRLACTGFEAIVKASCHLPGLILLDASLGPEVIEETTRLLAGCPSTAHIPIVETTARRRVPLRSIQHLAAAAVL